MHAPPVPCRAIQRPVEGGSAAGAVRLLALLRPALGGVMWRRWGRCTVLPRETSVLPAAPPLAKGVTRAGQLPARRACPAPPQSSNLKKSI
jgi:hypothetical protein